MPCREARAGDMARGVVGRGLGSCPALRKMEASKSLLPCRENGVRIVMPIHENSIRTNDQAGAFRSPQLDGLKSGVDRDHTMGRGAISHARAASVQDTDRVES